jgi:hypothetical protein
MNDRKAIRVARRLAVDVVTVPAFLLMVRASGPEAANRVRDLVGELEENDHYGFASDVRRRLLRACEFFADLLRAPPNRLSRRCGSST